MADPRLLPLPKLPTIATRVRSSSTSSRSSSPRGTAGTPQQPAPGWLMWFVLSVAFFSFSLVAIAWGNVNGNAPADDLPRSQAGSMLAPLCGPVIHDAFATLGELWVAGCCNCLAGGAHDGTSFGDLTNG